MIDDREQAIRAMQASMLIPLDKETLIRIVVEADAERARFSAEVRRLRALLKAHGIPDTEGGR